MAELERENAFYEAHRDEFREKYYDKYLLIVGDTLHGIYDKFYDAAKEALDNYEPGDFMITKPADDDKVIEIGPIIQFANTNYREEAEKGTITDIVGEPINIPYAW